MLVKFTGIVFSAFFLLTGSFLLGQNIKIVPNSGPDVTELKSLVRSITADCRDDGVHPNINAFIPVNNRCKKRRRLIIFGLYRSAGASESHPRRLFGSPP